MTDGKYIDFEGQDRMPLAYWQGFADALGILRIENKGVQFLDDYSDKWHNDMRTIPHEHWMSILGPYCVACRCNMPY